MTRKPHDSDDILDMCEDGRARDALKYGTTLLDANPDDLFLAVAVAEAALRSGDPAIAVVICGSALDRDPHDAGLNFHMGEFLQFNGDRKQADSHFHAAAQRDPRHYPRPFRVSEAVFDELAAAVVRGIPAELAEVLERRGTTVVAKPLPSLEMIVEDGLDPHALGYHFSNPFGIAGGYGTEPAPDAIEIYQLSIENWCADETTLRNQVRQTVLHELGHAFGMDHDELDEDGY